MTYSERRDKELLNEPGLTIVPPGPGWGEFIFSMLLVALLAWFFVQSAEKAGPEEKPQSGIGLRADANYMMNFLIRARQEHAPADGAGLTENFMRGLPHLTDGETQPLWPWAMSRLVDSEHRAAGFEPERDQSLLRRVKAAHIWMGAGFLLLCGLMAARMLSPGAVLPALLPGAVMALLAYGMDFGPAGMYYMLVFLSWVCALRLLRHNSVWLHGVFGVLTGLAWLTDVTALIVVAAWLLAATMRWLAICFRRGEQAVHETWIARNHFVGLLVVVIAWAAVSGSRCGAAMDHWRRPLFCWQQYWMWLDSDAEALRVANRYEDVRSLENGRRIDLPGWEDYWNAHTVEQARERLASGWKRVWGQFLGTTPPKSLRELPWKQSGLRQGWWLAGAAGLFVIAWIVMLTRRRGADHGALKIPSSSAASVIFVLLAALSYGLWYAWYVPIQSDPRFLMVLYLPLMWSLVWGAETMMRLARMRGASSRMWLGWQVLLGLFSAAMAADVVLLLNGTDLLAFSGRW